MRAMSDHPEKLTTDGMLVTREKHRKLFLAMLLASFYAVPANGCAMDDTLFTDEQLTGACGLHLDNLRRLITWGAVKPVQAGGGRGRVRLWSFQQAMRVAVTAEFFEAGFSLQMAHTLTYCLPLDDMLRLFDPEFIERYADLSAPPERHIKQLVSRRGSSYWLPAGSVGSEIVILDRRLVYADVLGQAPQLFGKIDRAGNRFYPTYDPKRFLSGVLSKAIGHPLQEAAIAQVGRESLLIDDRYFGADERDLTAYCHKITRGLETQLIGDEYLYRNLLKINLNTGLVIAFRRLLGLPVKYETADEHLHD
jgi:hypothetical protein